MLVFEFWPPPYAEIYGRISVVTENGENKRLGKTTVYIFDVDESIDFEKISSALRVATDQDQGETEVSLQEPKDRFEFVLNTIREIKEPFSIIRSARGDFSVLEVRAGRDYLIASCAEGLAGSSNEDEQFPWFVLIKDLTNRELRIVNLSNHNLATDPQESEKVIIPILLSDRSFSE